MEIQKTKIVSVVDFSGEKFFKIRLFNVMEGLDFADKIAGSVANFMNDKSFSVKSYLADLIPLAVPMDVSGKEVVWPERTAFSLNDAAVMFENPVALLDLGAQILEFQQVFFQNSALFQTFKETLGKNFLTPRSA